MAREKTDFLNAYELLLLQKVLTILFDLEEKKLGKAVFKEVGWELNVDDGTIAKFFNASYNSNVPSFRKVLLDELVNRLDLEKVKTWDYFKKKFSAPSLKNNPKDFIPRAHLSDLSEMRKTQIIGDVKATLKKLFPNQDFSKITYDSFGNIGGKLLQEPSKKLRKNFLNTKWFLYIFHSNMGDPKLARLVLRIGNTPNEVKIEHFGTPENNHFSGTVEFDKSESYLIFNLKTTATGEKDLHMKVAASTGVRPEITLGYFFNIGLNFPTLAWGDAVLEDITDLNDEQIVAKPLNVYDPEFFDVHPSIREYLRYDDPNLTILPTKIYSKYKLEHLIEARRDSAPTKPNEIRQNKKFKALVTFPKYSISNTEREKYIEPYSKLRKFLQEKDFEVVHDLLEESTGQASPPFKINFFYNRTSECDIYILLFFDQVVSNCLSELAWANQMGKKIIVFVPDRKIIPRTYHYDQARFTHIGECKTPNEAVDWFIQMFPFLLKKELKEMQKDEIRE